LAWLFIHGIALPFMNKLIPLLLVVLLSTFTQLFAGGVKVTISPSAASTAGARWRVDGGTWKTSGSTVSGLATGSHTLEFKAATGYVTPAPVAVSVGSGTTSRTITYVKSAALTMTLDATGAQWRVNGGTWMASGAKLSGLAPGSHQVEYSAVANTVAPVSENISLTAGQSLVVSRHYTKFGSITCNLLGATGTWSIDGGSYNASGATVQVAPGTHTVSFSSVVWYDTPAPQTVTITEAGSKTISAAYVSQRGSLTASLTPEIAKWRIDGGDWIESDVTVTGLVPGVHHIEYQDLAGYLAPAAEDIPLEVRQAFAFERSYQKLYPLQVTLLPETAHWRVAGGEWQTSGASVQVLTPEVTLEFETLEDYDALPAVTKTLLPDGTNAFSFAYELSNSVIRLSFTPTDAKARFNGGAWHSAGDIVEVPKGAVQVEFEAPLGYETPAARTLTLGAGEVYDLVVSFEQSYATVYLDLGLSTAGARFDGGNWHYNGEYVQVPKGIVMVEFLAPAGYDTPPSQTLTLLGGEARTLTVRFEQSYATVYLDLGLSMAGARFNGGQWHYSGEYVQVSKGSVAVDFLAPAGYDTPPAQTLTLTGGEQRSLLVRFEQSYATVYLDLGLSMAGARFNGGQWHYSGEYVQVPKGSVAVDFLAPAGYDTPPAQTLTLTGGEQRSLLVRFEQSYATVYLDLGLSMAGARFNGGQWHYSGEYVQVPKGIVTVDFLVPSGYETPPSQTLTLTGGEQRTLTLRLEQGYATVYLDFGTSTVGARFNGGQWYYSGAAVQVPKGTVTVDFLVSSGQDPIPSQTLTLAGGEYRYLTLGAGQTFATVQLDLGLSMAGARFNGGQWHYSGEYVQVPAGSVTVDFLAPYGYDTPPSQTLTYAGGEYRMLTVRFEPSFATVQLDLGLSTAAARFNGGEWHYSGEYVQVPKGPVTVDFLAPYGYDTPPSQTLTYAGGEYRMLTVRFEPSFATVQLDLGLSTAGASFNGGEWHYNGEYVQVPKGPVTVEFLAPFGYDTPPSQALTLLGGEYRTLTVRFEPSFATVQLDLGLSTAGARFNGGQWHYNGEYVQVPKGPVTVDFLAPSGYQTPASQQFIVAGGEFRKITVVFEPLNP